MPASAAIAPSEPAVAAAAAVAAPAKTPSAAEWAAAKLGLKYADDLRTLLLSGSYFALFSLMWLRRPAALFAAAGSDAWGLQTALYLSLWVFLCYLSFLGAVATHNCIHCPMFRARWANRAFQVALSLNYGHPVSSYVPGHNLSHHKYTQQTRDVMRTTKLRYRWHLLNGLCFFFRIGIDMVRNDTAYFKVQKQLGRPIIKQLQIEQCVLWSVTALLVLWDWRRWLLLAFLPHAYAKFCIISLNLLQHDGCDADSRYNFARNFTGRWLNWWCYNNGYHTVHHLHPGLHWSLLPERHEREIVPHMEPQLDQPFILTYIWRTFIWPGVRIDYLGQPWSPPPPVPDEPWFYHDAETYSNKEHN